MLQYFSGVKPGYGYLAARAVAALAAITVAGMAGAADKTALARGRALFNSGTQPACAICHALRDAEARGTVGPSLDELRPDAPRVLKAIRNGVGAMPPYDEQVLSTEDAQALARYVAAVAGTAR